MDGINDPSLLRTAKAYAKQQYEREMVRGGGPAPVGLEAIGFPQWSRAAWETFKQTYGRYPSIREGDLPNMQDAPDWAFELQGLRPPPVRVTTGGGSVGGQPVDPAGIGTLQKLIVNRGANLS